MKKIIGIITALALLISCVPVMAADCTISADSSTATENGTAVVTLKIENNPGMAIGKVKLNFDKTKLLPVVASKGDVLQNAYSFTSNIDDESIDASELDFVTITWMNMADITGDGTLAAIEFAVVGNPTGFLAGAMIFGTAGVFAGQYTATDNPFPVQLNGSNVSIEGYNINDRTYFQLRDVAGVVGGFEVGFANNTIQLSKDGYVYDNSALEQEVYIDDTYGFKLTIPDSWKGKYVVTVNDEDNTREVRFSEINNYNESGMGRIISFFIGDKNSVDYNDPDAIYGDGIRQIAEKDNLVVFITGPTDVNSKNEYVDKWRALVQSENELIDSFEWTN